MKETTCCIIGGGPAGVMLGYLLARGGVKVTVLEKHKDFFRDFRGDTVHPSTLDVLRELGLLDEFLRLPHQKVTHVGGVAGEFEFTAADFRHMPAHCKFVALMPQWDFLNFLSSKAKKFPAFELLMDHEAFDLMREGGRITGALAHGPGGATVEIRADLTIGCDGRQSIARKAGGLEVVDFGVPIDVLWFRISRQADDPEQVLGNFNYGKVLILINRLDYFQAGLIVPKGSFDAIKQSGPEAFRQNLLQIVPWLGDRVNELNDWDRIKLLTVEINRLRCWHRQGLLCIGDAAHAMSPAGGVGINLAIQDAVATANLIARPLRRGCATEPVLARLQKRREFPTRVTQALQIGAHKVFTAVFRNAGPLQVPWQLKAVMAVPGIQHVMGRVVGMGVLPEHVGRRKRSGAIFAMGAAFGAALAVLTMGARRRQRAHS